MSDDNDRFHWFTEDDDWWVELLTIIRSFVTNPVPVTLGQLTGLSTEIAKLTGEATARSPIDLRILEATLKTHDLEGLAVSSVVSLVELAAEQRARGESRFKDVLDNVDVMRLASIIRPKTGSLRPSDVVGLVRLAAHRNRPNADVFEKLSIDEVTKALSRSALRTVTLGELRSSLEELVGSGLLAKGAK